MKLVINLFNFIFNPMNFSSIYHLFIGLCFTLFSPLIKESIEGGKCVTNKFRKFDSVPSLLSIMVGQVVKLLCNNNLKRVL